MLTFRWRTTPRLHETVRSRHYRLRKESGASVNFLNLLTGAAALATKARRFHCAGPGLADPAAATPSQRIQYVQKVNTGTKALSHKNFTPIWGLSLIRKLSAITRADRACKASVRSR